MLKKNILILFTVLAAFTVCACGGKKESAAQAGSTAAQATVSPAAGEAEKTAATPTPAAQKPNEGLVEMEKTAAADDTTGISKTIGTKTNAAAHVILINQTNDEISSIYIRAALPEGDDSDEWGDELLKGSFTLPNNDKCVYYYDTGLKDDYGNKVTKYDIRVGYADEDKDEYFFRRIPLTAIKELRLCVDTTGDTAIPYARYMAGNGNREYSTLEEVKKRLGYSLEEEELIEDPTPVPEAATQEAEPTQAPAEDTGGDTEVTEEVDVYADEAKAYIGQSLADLEAAMGGASGEEYVDEPETGTTGYHYYDTFTVSTTVDENGNEVVAGVW